MNRINVDYETTGLSSYHGDRIFSYSLTDEEGNTGIYRLDWMDKAKNRRNEERLRDFWADWKVEKVAHNAIFEVEFTISHGIEIPRRTVVHDTMVMGHCLYNLFPTYKLEKLSHFVIGAEECEEYDEADRAIKRHRMMQDKIFKHLANKGPTRKYGDMLEAMRQEGVEPFVVDRTNYGLIPPSTMDPYQAADGERGMLLNLAMWKDLEKLGKKAMEDYYVEMALIRASEKMQRLGIQYNPPEGEKLRAWLEDKVEEARTQVFKAMGEEINLESPMQIGRVLFDKMDYPVLERGKQGPSTSSDVLKRLHDMTGDLVFDAIIRYRAYKNGLDNVTSYAKLAEPDGIIHYHVHTNSARTSRQSISDPSMQNVSKAVAAGVEYSVPARRCFRTRAGAVILAPDYGGIELRLIIDLAREEELLQKFSEDPEFDVHTFVADVMLDGALSRETDKDRRYMIRAAQKTYNFGKPYGGKFKTVAADLLMLFDRAFLMEGERRFAERWPSVFNFSGILENVIHETGYIVTPYGRRLWVHDHEAYKSANYTVQGTAGQALKRAEVRIDRWFEDEWDNRVRILFPVHDELLLHCPRDIWTDAKLRRKLVAGVDERMVYQPELRMPLVTEWKIIRTHWAGAEKLSKGELYG